MALALLVSVGGGVAGGVIATRIDGEASAPAAIEALAPEPALNARIRSAVDRVLPAVVTVLADLPPELDADGNVFTTRNVGSGIVISDAGHVVTNFHVINGAQELTVMLATGERRRAVLVSDDFPFTDLAVLAIPPGGLRVASFGDSSALRPGDTVVAIGGNIVAGGLLVSGNTVSVGVIAGLGRSLPRNGMILDDLLQTDAAANHGDSGGALVNLDGEVVGLLTTVIRVTPNGLTVDGVALAQSSNSLRPIVEQIVTTGFYSRPRLGIERPQRQHIEIVPSLAEAEGLPVSLGALVIAPEPGSPAEAAGIRAGDIVVAVNGAAVDLDHPFPNLVKLLPSGIDVDLLIVRGNRQMLITVSPSDSPTEE